MPGLIPARAPFRSFARVFVAALLLHAPLAGADPVPGFVEHWTSGTGGWTGGDFYANPGTGGVQGAGDGYLLVTTPGPSPFFTLNLGANNAGAAYTGNWTAAGITRVQFWLDDVGPSNPFEIHFALGPTDNLWQYNTGFVPPAGAWAPFVVDLTGGPTGWTQIITGGATTTFAQALQDVQKVLIRHDHAPFLQAPDTITADVGIDELSLLGSGNVGVAPPGVRVTRAVSLAPPAPNPAHGAVTLSIESYDRAPVRIEIFDAAGRRVRRAWLDAAAPGPRLWLWDGRTDDGSRAAPGAYRARAFSASGGMSRPFVWLGGGR